MSEPIEPTIGGERQRKLARATAYLVMTLDGCDLARSNIPRDMRDTVARIEQAESLLRLARTEAIAQTRPQEYHAEGNHARLDHHTAEYEYHGPRNAS